MSRRAATRGGSPRGARQALREPALVSAISRVVLLELERRGIPADRLLARHRIPRAQVQDPDAWIPQRAHAAFFRDAVAASGDPTFAWVAGRRSSVEGARLVGPGAVFSSTIREAVQTWARYYELMVDGTQVVVRSTPAYDAVCWNRLPALPPLHENCFSFAGAFLAFVERTAGPTRPVALLVTGPEPAGAAAVVVAVGAPVRWGAERFELRLPPGTLDRPLSTSDPTTRRRIIALAERDLAARLAPSVSERVGATILREGLWRMQEIGTVANLLGTTPRSLQRWLADEGRTFSQVQGEVLAEAAREMLSRPGSSIGDAASRLGFSSRTTFHRAVRRWTGKTPGELRTPEASRGRRRRLPGRM